LRPLAKPEARKANGERRAPRHRYVQFLWFHRLDVGSGGGLARSVDVSEQGLGFVTSQQIQCGERVFLVLLTPFGRISTIASVMHSAAERDGSFRIGVRLDVLPPTDRAAWSTLVDKEAS
jgi:hypothetical protein